MVQENYVEGCSMQRPPLLEPNGFCFWKARFETYVKSKYIDLWQVIQNGDFYFEVEDEETKLLKETSYELLKDEQKKKLGKNNEAKMTLYNALPRKEYERGFMCKIAKEMEVMKTKAKMKKAFFGGAWSDSEDGDKLEKDATCLMAIGSQKICAPMTLNKSPLRLKVQHTQSTRMSKQILNKANVPHRAYIMTKGEWLHYGIKEKSKLPLVVKLMGGLQTFVRIVTWIYIVMDVDRSHTIAHTEKYTQESIGIPMDQQRLALYGKRLDDDRCLVDCYVREGFTLDQVILH
ncbi:zf-CCHC domain-containing protein [Tanacetum coccineum]|uniref:Zf-CCHC domain-containing protein n=1 Tax=Tanacetum coccineum TaxID=301880 RepID=A0ABQ4ZQR5_9ASTR